MTKERLLQEYHKMAKAADRKLRNLEKLEADQGFKDATRFAYARAQKDIEARFGSGQSRFDKKLPEMYSKRQIISAMNDVQRFIESPSSSKKGIIDVYKQRADTLSKKYGTKITWKDMAVLFENSTFDKLVSKMTSDQVFKQIRKQKKQRSKIIKEIQEASRKISHISEEDVMKQIVKNLGEMQLTIADLE